MTISTMSPRSLIATGPCALAGAVTLPGPGGASASAVGTGQSLQMRDRGSLSEYVANTCVVSGHIAVPNEKTIGIT